MAGTSGRLLAVGFWRRLLTGLDIGLALALRVDGLLADSLAGLHDDGAAATDGGGAGGMRGTHHLEGHLRGKRNGGQVLEEGGCGGRRSKVVLPGGVRPGRLIWHARGA